MGKSKKSGKLGICEKKERRLLYALILNLQGVMLSMMLVKMSENHNC